MSEGNQTVGWIGLGRMCHPMAELLLRAGHTVQVWNRTRAKAEPLAAAGAAIRGTPADLADHEAAVRKYQLRRRR